MPPSPITPQSLNLYRFSFLVSQRKQFPGVYWEHKCGRCVLKYASVSSDSTQSDSSVPLKLNIFVFTLRDFENIRLRYTAEIHVVLICTSAYLSSSKKCIAFSCLLCIWFFFIPLNVHWAAMSSTPSTCSEGGELVAVHRWLLAQFLL